jgi:hypothetical protein
MSAQQLNTINRIGFGDDGCGYWNLKWNQCIRNNNTNHLHSNDIDLHKHKKKKVEKYRL